MKSKDDTWEVTGQLTRINLICVGLEVEESGQNGERQLERRIELRETKYQGEGDGGTRNTNTGKKYPVTKFSFKITSDFLLLQISLYRNRKG